jgi:hypothetical protein
VHWTKLLKFNGFVFVFVFVLRLLELRGLQGNIPNELDSRFARCLILHLLNSMLHLYLMMVAFHNLV